MNKRTISYNLNLSEKQTAKIETLLNKKTRYFQKYPWDKLESLCEEKNEKTLKIVGYGSLVNKQSAALTVTVQKRKLVVAFGVYRIFNYVIPKGHLRYGLPDQPKRISALNIGVTNKVSDYINALLIEIPISDIKALREREIAYDVIQVPCVPWDDREKEPFYSNILFCPYSDFNGLEKTKDNLEPHTEYYKVCRSGAYSFGEDFLNCWKSTTFLSDGVSSMNVWENSSNFGKP